MVECKDPLIISLRSPSWAFLSLVFLIRSLIMLIRGKKKRKRGGEIAKLDDKTLYYFTFSPGKYYGLEC